VTRTVETSERRLAPPVGEVSHPSSAASGRDSLGLLIVYVILLMGVPSALVISPLGAAGTPAGVIADGLLLLLFGSRLLWGGWGGRRNPVTLCLMFFALAIVASYVAGASRPIAATELSSADRGLLILAGWVGVALMVETGITSREKLNRLLTVVVVGGGVLALLGMLQFFLGLDIAQYLRPPGLRVNGSLGGLNERQGFVRIDGTAQHPIEFGAVLSLVLPLAIHRCAYANRHRRLYLLCAALIGFAIPLTVARSAILGLAVVLGLLFLTATPRQRWRALLMAPIALVAVKAAAPQLLGTLLHLFTRAKDDPSIQNRLGDWTTAGYYFTQAPITGRGFFTFNPGTYRTFDNQYLGLLVESGTLGLVAFLVLLGSSCGVALLVRRRTSDRETRSLAYALLVSMATAAISFVTFDAFAFPMVMGLLFLLVGAVACLWRIVVAPHVPRRPIDANRSRRVMAAGWALAAAVSVLGPGALLSHRAPAYQAVLVSSLASGPDPRSNRYVHGIYLGDLPVLIRAAINGPEMRPRLARQGVKEYHVVGEEGSLAEGAEHQGVGDLLVVGAIASSPQKAVRDARVVLSQTAGILRDWQGSAGATRGWFIGLGITSIPRVERQQGSFIRAMSGLLILAVAAARIVYVGVQERPWRR
jgi:O-antigen ligase